ncbi:P-loop containing nucleoside triphosphate hydrolase [Pseudocohnilembus persalinus]|uniref:p-loop containing nucleoside triphosphate hydrolase n=1 Tax=Pseudocohnilembus persalinus TaxID=266149 RepID=A0A0V0R4K3_PSEPJ|nr:P-loop containing nucleoside triphosphate hydrolase [Pseudocohnilembus persalinus]|eukprot:KRX09412.1 P-loop containing nucleoside triphosphate hydrolase [Pseudocohnilembus persalinus]
MSEPEILTKENSNKESEEINTLYERIQEYQTSEQRYLRDIEKLKQELEEEKIKSGQNSNQNSNDIVIQERDDAIAQSQQKQNELQQKLQQIKELEEKIETINKENAEKFKDLETERDGYKKNNQLKQNNIENLEKKLKESYDKYFILENANKDVSALLEEKKQLEKQKKQIKTDLQEVSKKYDSLKQLCSENNLGQQILKKHLAEFEPKVQNDSVSTQLQSQSDSLDQMDGYDAQIKFTGIKQLLKYGADICLRFKKDSTQYQNALSKNVHLVSFLGLKNAGKSYWHSKLSKQIIKQGNLHATQGLNVNFCEKFWFVDSPGLGETLQNFSEVYNLQKEYQEVCTEIDTLSQQQEQEIDEEFKNKLISKKISLKNDMDNLKKEILDQQNEIYKEKMALENFIQSFIMEYSDVIIYVCDILNLEEQRYITQITQKIKKNNKNQQLIVCHNMKTIDNIPDFEKCIAKDIYNNFAIQFDEKVDFTKCAYKNFGYNIDDKDQQSSTTHVVFGKEGTEVAEKYNKKSIDYIFSSLENFAKQGTTQNMFDSFKNYTNKHIKEYIIWKSLKLDGQNEDETPQESELEPEFKVCHEKNKIYSLKHEMLEEKSIKCKDIITDFLGQKISDFESGARNCFYQVYKKEVERGITIKTILISVPGIKMVESVKTRMISDNNRQLRIMCVSIKYMKGESEKLLKEISVDQNDEEQDYLNNQKLQFQDVKFDIPICNIAESYMKGGEYDSLKAKSLDDFSVYKINVEIQKDEVSSDFD